jgi:defect-in-organelle-trafficking protein DotA
LCQYLGGYRARADKVVALIAGTLIQATVPNLNGGLVTDVNLTTDQNASTVFGFTGNSVIYKALAQPGQNGISVIKPKPYKPENYFFQMPKIDFGCRKLGIWGKIGFCLGPVGDLLYNVILLNVFNAILVSVQVLVSRVLQVVLYIPLLTAQEIFMQGLRTISEPNVNPIVALAQMGTRYINTSLDIWMLTLAMDLAIAVVPFVGFAVMVALMSVVMPILLSWLGVMLGIGFVTSFYVPMLPYMIFTFGSIAWFLAVIEAMVAAPIVALGVTHPEGHDMFGKGEGAIMILMNVFLRPSLMIIGYIAGIAMTYISIWVINAGYNEAISFMTGNTIIASSPNDISVNTLGKPVAIRNKTNPGVYSGWASIYGFFMAIIIYTSMYITVVTKAFSLIAVLPDKVLRWIGGSPESAGQEAAGWSEDTKGHIKEAGDATKMGTVSAQKKLGALGGEGAEALRKKFTKGGASVKASENPGKDAS